jgi:hypothetical protein
VLLGVTRAFEGLREGVQGGFPPDHHRALPRLVGSRERVTRYRHFEGLMVAAGRLGCINCVDVSALAIQGTTQGSARTPEPWLKDSE